MSDSLRPHGLLPTRLLCPWDFPGKNTGLACHFLLQGILQIHGLNPCLLHRQTDSSPLSHLASPYIDMLLLGCFSRVLLCAILWTAARQAPLSMGFSRQEYWSGLPFPTPGNLPNPGMEPTSPVSPALAGRFFIDVSAGKP